MMEGYGLSAVADAQMMNSVQEPARSLAQIADAVGRVQAITGLTRRMLNRVAPPDTPPGSQGLLGDGALNVTKQGLPPYTVSLNALHSSLDQLNATLDQLDKHV